MHVLWANSSIHDIVQNNTEMAMGPFLFILMISTHKQGFISFLCTIRASIGCWSLFFSSSFTNEQKFYKSWTISFYFSLLSVLRTCFSNPWCFFGQIFPSSHQPVCVCVCAIFFLDFFMNNSLCQVFWNLFKNKIVFISSCHSSTS